MHKLDDIQVLASDVDLIAVTETWLKPDILDCELLPNLEFTIYRQDGVCRPGGGVMLAASNNINCIRRPDLKCNAEALFCEIHPNSRRKLLVAVFYRPPDSSLDYTRELKRSLPLAGQTYLDQLLICEDFNLPNIDWNTAINDPIHKCFAKLVRDNYLWQLVDFSMRNTNTLDLILTNIPEKVRNVHGFDDFINTDHKLMSFILDFHIPKKPIVKRSVFNYNEANWDGLNEAIRNPLWDLAFIPNDVEAFLSNWCDLFLSAVSDHVPTRSARNTFDHPWLDSELFHFN